MDESSDDREQIGLERSVRRGRGLTSALHHHGKKAFSQDQLCVALW